MSHTSKRTLSEADVPLERAHDLRNKRHKTQYYVPHQPLSREMGPPPTPIDPTLTNRNAVPAPNMGLDQFFITSPPPLQRPYPPELNLTANCSPESQVSSMRPSQIEMNQPLNFQSDPWDPQRIRGSTQPQIMNPSLARERLYPPGPMTYGSPERKSDMDSNNGMAFPDSAYWTQTRAATESVYSGEMTSNPEYVSLPGGMNEADFPRSRHYEVYPEPTNDRSKGGTSENPEEYPFDLVCQICNLKSKNRSEFNKHKLRHDKPFRCDVESCTRTEGFTTQNDLDRHKKSLHQVHCGKSFMCAAPHCAKKTKVWPRADNFRQHCQRLHKDIDLTELMDRSWELSVQRSRNPGKGFGLVEASPYDVRLNHLDTTQSHLVHMQDIHLAPQGDMPLEDYHPGNDAYYTTDVIQIPTDDDMAIHQGKNYLEQSDTLASGHQPSAFDHPSLLTRETTGGVLDTMSPTTRPPSDVERLRSPVQEPERSTTDYRTVPSNANFLQSRDNSTSRPQLISQEMISTMTANITDRLKIGKHDKADLERAIQAEVLSMIGNNQVNKTRTNVEIPASRNLTAASERSLFQCDYCHKKKKTQCDLTKHTKRHTRPYGCTYSNCPRRFGSKNDWKRHENTMHWQVEAWKCAEPRDKASRNPVLITSKTKPKTNTNTSTTNSKTHTIPQLKTKHQCGQVFYRREQFASHLEENHSLKSNHDYVRDQCRQRRVGRNGQKGFWCGFCQTVVELKERGLKAWDERFTHIDEQHFRQNQRVEDWFPIDEELPKGILDDEGVIDGDGDGNSSDGSIRSTGKGSDEEKSGSDVEEIVDPLHPLLRPAPQPQSSTPRKPIHKGDTASSLPQQKIKVWFCCHCNDGPKSRDLTDTCLRSDQGCSHRRCGKCKHELSNVGDQSGI